MDMNTREQNNRYKTGISTSQRKTEPEYPRM